LTLIIGLIGEEVSDLREDWMKHADAVLADEDILRPVRRIGETTSQDPLSWALWRTS
jgi:hypothetical protein